MSKQDEYNDKIIENQHGVLMRCLGLLTNGLRVHLNLGNSMNSLSLF